MTIPSYQNMMLPLLQCLKDGKPRSLTSIQKYLANHFHLSEEEQRQKKLSGHGTLFQNRVHWAKFFLKRARLVSSPLKSDVKITARGLQVLNEKPDKIDVGYLNRFLVPSEI